MTSPIPIAAFRAAAIAAAAFLALQRESLAQDWPHWRGPRHNGSAPEQKLPTSFGRTENLAWTAPMPGEAASTPVVWGDRLFVSSTDAATRSLLALALDRRTGKELWRHKIADGDRRDNRSSYASPSPVTDGHHVWFFFGQGDLTAYTVEGKEAWRRNIQKDHGTFAFLWTFASSPLLHDGKLYLQVLQRDVPVQGRGKTEGPNDSYLLALDAASGKDLWRVVRPSEAREESREAFTSPVPWTDSGRTEILVTGGDCLSGHDPVTGKENWRWGTWNPQRITHWRLVVSPVGGAGHALACGPKGSPIFAVKAGQQGTLPPQGFAWTSSDRDLSTDVSTPLFYRNRFFVLNSDKRLLFCVEPSDGRILWKGEIPSRSKIEASPTASDGRIFAINHAAEVFVLGAGDKFEVLHTTSLAEEGEKDIRASVAIAHGSLFVRTTRSLFAFGPKN